MSPRGARNIKAHPPRPPPPSWCRMPPQRRRRRVCNAVCNCPGHNVAQPGTTWHKPQLGETPQAPTRGTDRHFVAQRGTTWHNGRTRFESCRAYHTDCHGWPRNQGFGAIRISAGPSVQCSVQLGRPHPGTPRHDVALPGTTWHGPGAADLGRCVLGPAVPTSAKGASGASGSARRADRWGHARRWGGWRRIWARWLGGAARSPWAGGCRRPWGPLGATVRCVGRC
jgi:hypothetical protein